VRLAWGIVTGVRETAPGIQRIAVSIDSGEPSPALCYPALTGASAVGERVLLNTTAVDRGLGTGGEHFVVARDVTSPLDEAVPGHCIKLRYTPLQRDLTAVEEAASPHHKIMAEATTLPGTPVVCCGLHSQLLPVAAAIKEQRPGARVVYVMSDEAALPIAVSRLVRAMREADLLDATITCGQAFGGELEAVSLHSALLAAHHVASADVIVVAIGPGIAGTATPFGHGGVAQGEAVNAAAALGGRPIAPLRVSFTDSRQRHLGVSHQTIAALGTVALARAVVPVPRLAETEAVVIERQLAEASISSRHDCETLEVGTLPDSRGIAYASMGRAEADDPAFFLAAAAAGAVAARLAAQGD
jgi:hypothetical protein